MTSVPPHRRWTGLKCACPGKGTLNRRWRFSSCILQLPWGLPMGNPRQRILWRFHVSLKLAFLLHVLRKEIVDVTAICVAVAQSIKSSFHAMKICNAELRLCLAKNLQDWESHSDYQEVAYASERRVFRRPFCPFVCTVTGSFRCCPKLHQGHELMVVSSLGNGEMINAARHLCHYGNAID